MKQLIGVTLKPGLTIEVWRDGLDVVAACQQTRLRVYECETEQSAEETFNTIRDTLIDVSNIMTSGR